MKEQLISFETAKLAKEKGFYINTNGNFSREKSAIWLNPTYYELSKYYFENDELLISKVTQSLLQKWLREVHEIHVCIIVWRDMDHVDNYIVSIIKPAYIKPLYDIDLDGLDIMDESKDLYFKHSYEEALEVGLQEALKLIKQN